MKTLNFKHHLLYLFSFLLLYFFSPQLKAQSTSIYLSLSSSEIGYLNTDLCQYTKIGSTGTVMRDIALCPNGMLYSITGTKLYSINKTSAAITLIGTTGFYGLTGLACDTNNQLWAASGISDQLLKVNSSTGVATAIGNTGYNCYGGLTFYNDTLYMAASNNTLVKVDQITPSQSVSIDTMPVPACVVGGACTVPACVGATTTNGICSCDTCNMAGLHVFTVVTIQKGVCPNNQIMLATVDRSIYTANTSSAALTPLCFNAVPSTIYGASEYSLISPCPVSVETLIETNAISVYPNPNYGSFRIQFSDGIIKIEIKNILGQMIYSSETKDKNLEINLSDVPQGIYVLTANSEKKVITKKIIIE